MPAARPAGLAAVAVDRPFLAEVAAAMPEFTAVLPAVVKGLSFSSGLTLRPKKAEQHTSIVLPA